MSGLKERSGEMVVLHVVSGWKLRQIADRFGATLSEVREILTDAGVKFKSERKPVVKEARRYRDHPVASHLGLADPYSPEPINHDAHVGRVLMVKPSGFPVFDLEKARAAVTAEVAPLLHTPNSNCGQGRLSQSHSESKQGKVSA